MGQTFCLSTDALFFPYFRVKIIDPARVLSNKKEQFEIFSIRSKNNLRVPKMSANPLTCDGGGFQAKNAAFVVGHQQMRSMWRKGQLSQNAFLISS